MPGRINSLVGCMPCRVKAPVWGECPVGSNPRVVSSVRGVKKSGVHKMARSDDAMSQGHTHKFQKKCILIIMPMYKRERVGVLLTVSSHLKRQVHKSI